MKKYLFIIMGLSMSLYIVAQETKKQNEIGLVFSNLDNFGLTYKTGTSNSLWRFTTLFISGYNSEQNKDEFIETRNNAGLGIKIGQESRKALAEHLEFRYGADISFIYNSSSLENDYKTSNTNDKHYKTITYSPGVNGVFGLNYVFNNNLVIGAELMPYIEYSTGSTKEKNYNDSQGIETKTKTSGFSYGISNSSVQLSLAYRF